MRPQKRRDDGCNNELFKPKQIIDLASEGTDHPVIRRFTDSPKSIDMLN